MQQRWSLHSDNGGERRGAMGTATEGQALSVCSQRQLVAPLSQGARGGQMWMSISPQPCGGRHRAPPGSQCLGEIARGAATVVVPLDSRIY